MNRQHWREMLPIITAFANGEQIEGRRTDSDEWERGSVFEFSRNPECYRIAPRTIRIDASPGMSLRDWFAGQALAGLLASGHFTTPPDESEIAWMTTHEDPWDDETGEAIHKGRHRFDFPEAAWKCADAMIAYKRKEDQ